jgi:hypothetical protein
LRKSTYRKDQIQLIETMWAEYWPITAIAEKLGKSPTAVKEKVRYIGLPNRDKHLIRLLNYYGRDLLKYGTNRKEIKQKLQFERELLKIKKIKGRLDRQHIALEYLKYELEKGRDKHTAMKRAFRRDATPHKIALMLKMTTKEVTAIVRDDAKYFSPAARLERKRARNHHSDSYSIARR